jgi:hypothetical protein
MVPRVAMFTTAGDTFLIMGASVGSGVSPTMGGSPAEPAVPATARISPKATAAHFMPAEF